MHTIEMYFNHMKYNTRLAATRVNRLHKLRLRVSKIHLEPSVPIRCAMICRVPFSPLYMRIMLWFINDNSKDTVR